MELQTFVELVCRYKNVLQIVVEESCINKMDLQTQL